MKGRILAHRRGPDVPRTRPRAFRRPRLLIVGCGDVGKRIASRLGPRWIVFGTARERATADGLRAIGIRPLLADLDDRASLRRAAALAHWTVYLAPPPNVGEDDPRIRAWLAAAAGRGAPRGAAMASRFVYVSTTGVYGDQAGARIDETTPVRPKTARATRRVAAERRLRVAATSAAGTAHPMRTAILRAPGIYARERLPLQRLRAGLPVASGEGDVHTNHVHADDLARLAVLALMRARPGRVLNAVDASELTIGQWLDRVADLSGLPRPPRVPRERLAELVTPMMLTFMSESRRIDGRRVQRELRTRLLWPTVDDFLAGEIRDRAAPSSAPGNTSAR